MENLGSRCKSSHPDVHFYDQLPSRTHLSWEASPRQEHGGAYCPSRIFPN